MSEIREAIRRHAIGIGFDAVGFAPATLAREARDGLAAFLAKGHHGDMGWLAEKADRRGDPQTLWPDARTVIVLGMNYGPEGDPLALLGQGDRADISVYARNRDYHDTVKKRLKELARWIAARCATEVKVFVDTAPVMEKPLAAQAGLGWQGKHTNLVSRQWGSWLFLGEVFTALEIPPDAPEIDHCGSCRNCLDVCPTQAFPAPYQLDARRCISYLTIEHRGPIPRGLRPLIGNRIYGCDDCLAVCPWNKFAQAGGHADFQARSELDGPHLIDLAGLDDPGFRALFRASPVKRIGRDRFIRNVLIAIGNSADPALIRAVQPLLDDPSPLVRGAAVWALSRLNPTGIVEFIPTTAERDATVQDEWAQALRPEHP